MRKMGISKGLMSTLNFLSLWLCNAIYLELGNRWPKEVRGTIKQIKIMDGRHSHHGSSAGVYEDGVINISVREYYLHNKKYVAGNYYTYSELVDIMAHEIAHAAHDNIYGETDEPHTTEWYNLYEKYLKYINSKYFKG